MLSPIIRRLTVSLVLGLTLLAVIGLLFARSAQVRASGGGTPFPGASPCDLGSGLQACINAASPGDEIDIASGTYTESFTLDQAVSLKGDGKDTTFLIAANADRVLTVTGSSIDDSVKISGLTFQGGYLATGVGGGILITNGAQPKIEDIALIGNHAYQGGGLYASVGSTLTLEAADVVSNSATNAGGGVYGASQLSVSDSLIQNNAGTSGGGLYADDELDMTYVNVVSNSALIGGGVFAANGEVSIEGGSFDQNVSTNGPGGGLNVVSGETYLNYPAFTNNAAYGVAGDGGGAHFGSGEVGVMGGYFEWNHADGRGGALDKVGSDSLNVGYVCFSDNDSASSTDGGGAIHSTSQLTVTQSCFDSNTSANRGGAIFADTAQLLLAQSSLVNNHADSGGGVYLNGNFNGQIENSLFARNEVSTTGAAMVLDSFSAVSVTHNTIADVNLNPNAAIEVQAGFAAIKDTIIASHTIGISLTAGSADEDYNLFFGNGLTETNFIVDGVHSLIGGDPRFTDPTNDDYHLTTGSPAINAGVDAGVYTDYDGDARPLLGAFDIGYDETHNGLNTFSIQAAIDAANPILTPTIFIPAGVYAESLNLWKPVNLMGISGSSSVFIYGTGSDRVLTVSVPLAVSTIIISGVTFADGDARYAECGCGGGVLITNTNSVALNDVVITNSVAGAKGGGLAVFNSNVALNDGTDVAHNQAQGTYVSLNPAVRQTNNYVESKGGGLFAANANVMLNAGAAIEFNQADFGGGVYLQNNVLNLFGGSINDNQAYTSGGGVYVEQANAAVHKPGSSIEHNTANDGAGVFVQDGQFDQSGGDISDNVANNWGGGVLAANVNSSVKLNGGKILSNSASSGGGVFIDSGSVDFSSGLIVSNTAWEGGGAYVYSATAVLTDSAGLIVSNTASNGGGVAVEQGRFKLLNGLIAGNAADYEGGAIFLNDPLGSVVQSGGLIVHNQAQYGGAAKIINGQYYLIDGEIGSNEATESGGGIYVYDVNAAFHQVGGVIDHNTANDGGGVVVDMGTATVNGGLIASNVVTGSGGGVYVGSNGTFALSNTDILSNTAGNAGGGLYAEAPITLTAGRFVNNTANDGGGLYAQSDVNLTGGYYRSNSVTNDGGGLNVGGNLSMDLIDLNGNSADNDGGAVHAQNAATFNSINFVDNSATSGGGGVYVYGPLTATNSRFENNSGDYGGGAYVGGVANLYNTALVSNTAVTGHGGGLSGWAEVNAINSTFTANHCDGAGCKGGGIYAEDILVLTNTDFLSNTAAANSGGAWVNADAQVTGGLFRNNTSTASEGVGALGVNGNLTMTNSSFVNNTGSLSYGGAVWVLNGSAWLNGGSFRNNVGSNGGAINVEDGTLWASGTIFTGNEATESGGAIYANDVNLDTVYLQNNTGGGAGGVWSQSTVVATATQFISNSATYTDTSGNGGAVYAATVILTNSTLAGNQSQYQSGGGVYATDLILDNVTFNANSAFGNGGGAFVENSAVANGSTFKNNLSQGQGGALAADSWVAVTFTEFSNNSASSDGGAIYSTGDATALDSIFSANTSGGNGGGLFVTDNATLLRDRMANNNAIQGGGLYADSNWSDQLNVARSKFIANTAAVGGGLYHTGVGNGTIVNSLFARNTATTGADGLSLNSTGEVDVLFSTLANPSTSTGQAIVINDGTVNVTNTIVASFSIGLKQTGGTAVEDYNLYFANTHNQIGAVSQLGNSISNADPLFVKPSVDDYHLSLFSPAVDNALDLGVTNDLGGWPRPMGSGFDRGAFELQAQTTKVDPVLGGQLHYTDTQGLTTTVLLPPGLVTTNTTIIFNNLNGDSITSTPPSGLMFINKLFDLDAFLGSIQLHNITFTKSVTLVLQYSDADVAGIDEDSLKLYRFETSVNGWRPIGFRAGESQILDVDNNTLTVVLRGFSRFGRMGSSQLYEVFLPIVTKKH